MNILITGANGYVATELYRSFKDKYQISCINRTILDLSDSRSVNNWFNDKYFDVVIHTAVRGGSRLTPDDDGVLDNNLKMYYNLLDNRSHYGKFINIGSGAEIYAKDTLYGLSKHIIRQSLLSKDNFYNIRIFAVFNENEWDTRFIKANIQRYINREKVIIFQDKLMDFYYMEDLISVVGYYVDNTNIPKEYDCCYSQHHYLSAIANKINKLSDYSVPIEIVDNSQKADNYIGTYTPLPISLKGIDAGINNVYERLLCKK